MNKCVFCGEYPEVTMEETETEYIFKYRCCVKKDYKFNKYETCNVNSLRMEADRLWDLDQRKEQYDFATVWD